ncbi:MAG: hypothetical protein HOP29_13970 [Phycisphaerales bacterium]|nr:hypothetical protein [Phycisphaerales bacterium]
MQVDTVVQMIGSGNFKVAEQAWMSAIEGSSCTPDRLAEMMPVLAALVEREQLGMAESLAWATVETMTQKGAADEALAIGKSLALLLNRSANLQKQVAALYREAYADRDSLDALISAAGMDGGRPPRRAIRTMDFCLAIKPGAYLIGRHEAAAARVESIDPTTWEITIHDGKKKRSLDPVTCADEYEPCDAGDFRARVAFDTDAIRILAVKDPAALVECVLKAHGPKIDGAALEQIVTRSVLTHAEWDKWWTKARAAIRRSRHVRLDGRGPYTLEYIPDAGGHGTEFESQFETLHTPAERLAALDAYARDCKARRHDPDRDMLLRLKAAVAQRAAKLAKGGGKVAFLSHLVAGQIGELMGDADADKDAIAMLSSTDDPRGLIRTCDSVGLYRRAFGCLECARSKDWVAVLLDLFPTVPPAACDDIAERLTRADVPAERIESLIATILGDPANCCEAFCWLWDKGSSIPRWNTTPPVTLLTRLLALMADVQRDERPDRNRVRDIQTVVRNALSARKYERFEQCLGQIEMGMAAALRTQIRRLHNLGRAVHEDLQASIRARFPELHAKAAIAVWAKEDVILATERGILRWKADIDDLVNVKMKENAKAIGAAAEKGDLSENSEYKFALEERDLLRARLANLRDQMAAAKVLRPEDVPDDHVSVGSRVKFRNVNQSATFAMTFLGPFEANVEKHVYNYKAPLAQELMGRRVGERVELPMADPPGSYEIVGFEPWDV